MVDTVVWDHTAPHMAADTEVWAWAHMAALDRTVGWDHTEEWAMEAMAGWVAWAWEVWVWEV